VEDQQSTAGDLTDEGDDKAGPVPVGKARRGRARRDPAPEVQAVVPEPTEFAERRKAGRWAPAALGVAAALFIGSAAFAGATVQPYLSNRAVVDTKLDIARTAAEAITTLWTYTPDNMESLADRSARFLGGDFEAQYRKYVDAIAPTNKQAQVTNNTQVVGAAVETLNGPDATAIVYTNSTATSPLTKDIPSLRYLSYRLTLKRDAATWLVTSMNTITSLDLTPQI
jgi:Mce-associated membrane protein